MTSNPLIGTKAQQAEVELYHAKGCEVCPLAKLDNEHPNMKPTGSSRPIVYILGEGPGAQEDEQNEQFVGSSGRLLRGKIPKEYRNSVRYNNVVRTRPHKNATPDFVSIECCRPSVVADIERTKPRAIFGFGNTPLYWVTGFTGINAWRGRRIPVKIGSHTTWFYPMLHPAYILRMQKAGFKGEEPEAFAQDLRQAFAELDVLPKPVVHNEERITEGVELLKSVADIKRALRWAVQQPYVGVDYETNGLRPYNKDMKILSAAVGTKKRSFAFAIWHPQANWREEERGDILNIWTRFLMEANGAKIVHNLAFELEWSGVKLGKETIRTGMWEDTAVQATVIDERVGGAKPGPASLEFLCMQYFGFNIKTRAGVDRAALADQHIDRVLSYNAIDAKYHLLLWEKQRELILDRGLVSTYNLSLRRVPTVVLTQMKGLPVNQSTVIKLEKKYKARVEEITKKINSLDIVKRFEAKQEHPFNSKSHKDCVYVFWNMLKREECKVINKKTKQPGYSVAEEILEQIKHPLSRNIIALRKAQRQLSTYIVPLKSGHENTVIFDDGMIHGIFNTYFARSGRLSSDSPNLQNFPKRDHEAVEVRAPIVSPKGCCSVAVDYGQIEARVIAMFTKDKTFVKALWENYDVHMEWAERIAHAYPARVGGKKILAEYKAGTEVGKKAMKDFRTDIKNQWTFPLFFGAQLSSASHYLNIPEDALKPLYRAFWKQFSGVKDWQEKQMKFYKEHFYVECLTGRRRHGPLTENQVYNSPVQGTAAEIVMDAMCRLSELGYETLQPEINIHDDLTFMRIPEKELDSHIEKIVDIMLDVPFKWVNVPITAEVSVGSNWADMEEVGKFSSDTWFK